jgi:hypothetical protein
MVMAVPVIMMKMIIIIGAIREQASASGNASVFHSRGALFESSPGHRLS